MTIFTACIRIPCTVTVARQVSLFVLSDSCRYAFLAVIADAIHGFRTVPGQMSRTYQSSTRDLASPGHQVDGCCRGERGVLGGSGLIVQMVLTMIERCHRSRSLLPLLLRPAVRSVPRDRPSSSAWSLR